MGSHLIDGEFQSDKYPTTPRGKVPLSVKDKSAQDLLWEYSKRHLSVDAEFSTDLQVALQLAGFRAPVPGPMKAYRVWVTLPSTRGLPPMETVSSVAYARRERAEKRSAFLQFRRGQGWAHEVREEMIPRDDPTFGRLMSLVMDDDADDELTEVTDDTTVPKVVPETPASLPTTPNQLYLREPDRTLNDSYSDLSWLRGYDFDHVPEVQGALPEHADPQGRVAIRVYQHVRFDPTRYWRLASAWIDGQPFMITQNAGRDGYDWHRRIITSAPLYLRAIGHLQSIVTRPFVDESMEKDVVDADVELAEKLTSFYGSTLDGYFDRY
jgi:hypothetical protein